MTKRETGKRVSIKPAKTGATKKVRHRSWKEYFESALPFPGFPKPLRDRRPEKVDPL